MLDPPCQEILIDSVNEALLVKSELSEGQLCQLTSAEKRLKQNLKNKVLAKGDSYKLYNSLEEAISAPVGPVKNMNKEETRRFETILTKAISK